MSYVVTGGTGFVGRFLVERLLERRDGMVHVLVRDGSEARLERLRERLHGGDRLRGLRGDLLQPCLGVADDDIEALRGRVEHLFHLAAVYDLDADAEVMRRANVDGTRAMVAFAEAVEAGTVHHMSSLAAAGRYEGTFTEDMFTEATDLDHPYLATKHEAEREVRRHCERPWRIYRPGVVIGHSQTGEADKPDGPYLFFPLLKRLRHALPAWFPLLGPEGRATPVVPVDFVAAAVDEIAHADGLDEQTFHLFEPEPMSAGQLLNTFAQAAGAPQLQLRVDPRAVEAVPTGVTRTLGAFPPVSRLVDTLLEDLGVPRAALRFVAHPTTFTSDNTAAALEGTGIACPPLASYAGRVWDYWAPHPRPGPVPRPLAGRCRRREAGHGDRRVQRHRRAARPRAQRRRCAHVLVVARRKERLDELVAEITGQGGRATAYPADLSDTEAAEHLVDDVIAAEGGVDILVNNAGISIRRSLERSYRRMRDFERTMRLNYFGALALILGFVPGMRERGVGHIVNVSSIGAQTNTPRFSAYVASKSALDAFARCIASEVIDDGVHITTVYMPLVRTPMIAPTDLYTVVPGPWNPPRPPSCCATRSSTGPKRSRPDWATRPRSCTRCHRRPWTAC